MSLLPYLFDDFVDVPPPPPARYHHSWDMWPRDWFHSPFNHRFGSLRPWLNDGDTIEKQTHIGNDGFQVCLDVQHFQPNEIKVKTYDNTIVIDAKHEERQDEHGYVTREFQRRYRLPENINVKDVVSSISSDGILTVKAPPATPAVAGNVRHIQIQQTGPARLSIEKKDDKKKDN